VDATPVDATTPLAGRYRILGLLGTGGMSVVWRAHDDVLDRAVAIKVLASDHLADPASRARVQSEARAAAALTHPNVAAVHDYGESPGLAGHPVPYVVMELVEGLSLTEVLADGPVGPVEAMRICTDVARGLAAAHVRGLVHRDVKPGNVIVTAHGAKLVDFGLAAAIGAPDEADEDGVMFGTPAYLAPERLEDGVVVAGSDVYALGLLLYRMLAGTTPWSAQTTTQMLKAHAYLPPQPLPRTLGVPCDVADLCERCLAKDPADRPSARAVAAELAGAVERAAGLRPGAGGREDGVESGIHSTGEGDHAPHAGVVGAQRSHDVSGRRRRRLTVFAAALVVLLMGLVLVIVRPFGRASGPRDPADRPPAIGGVPATQLPSPGTADSRATPTGTGAGGPDAGPGGNPASTETGGAVGSPGGPPGPDAGGPGGGTTPPGEPEATADPARRDVRTVGGSAVVECTGAGARLVTWAPADGYQTQLVQPGPNPSVQVMFRAGNRHVGIRASCVDGVPDVTVSEAAG
jgi:tRNA A-37 threonylcarbamoyl transferase component Bud32